LEICVLFIRKAPTASLNRPHGEDETTRSLPVASCIAQSEHTIPATILLELCAVQSDFVAFGVNPALDGCADQ